MRSHFAAAVMPSMICWRGTALEMKLEQRHAWQAHAEHELIHDRPVTGVGAKSAHPFAEGSEFSVGVEERDIDPSPRPLLHIDFDDLDLRLTGPQEGPQALEDDHVVVDERDLDRFGRIGLATAAL